MATIPEIEGLTLVDQKREFEITRDGIRYFMALTYKNVIEFDHLVQAAESQFVKLLEMYPAVAGIRIKRP